MKKNQPTRKCICCNKDFKLKRFNQLYCSHTCLLIKRNKTFDRYEIEKLTLKDKRSGKLSYTQVCEICGEGTKLEMHHPIYKIELYWLVLCLCKSCHIDMDRLNKI